MSLQAIEQAIEKVAAMPGFGAIAKKTFSQGSTWKDIGKKSLIGAGVSAAGNVALGDSNQSIAERAVKGGVAGGAVVGLYGAGKQLHGQAVRTGASTGRAGFVRNEARHGKFGNQTPEQRSAFKSDMTNHFKLNNPPKA